MLNCRFIEPVGKRYEVSWIMQAEGNHVHVHREPITEEVWNSGAAKFAQYERESITCDECGQTFKTSPGFGSRTTWNTEDGEIHPGDMYWAAYYHDDGKCLSGWENCTDPRGHLLVRLPNGHTWDIDSRASNCTMREDKTHKCWVRHGEPPLITVDKNGHTCAAGAGSILSGDYHGFLRNGQFTDC